MMAVDQPCVFSLIVIFLRYGVGRCHRIVSNLFFLFFFFIASYCNNIVRSGVGVGNCTIMEIELKSVYLGKLCQPSNTIIKFPLLSYS